MDGSYLCISQIQYLSLCLSNAQHKFGTSVGWRGGGSGGVASRLLCMLLHINSGSQQAFNCYPSLAAPFLTTKWGVANNDVNKLPPRSRIESICHRRRC